MNMQSSKITWLIGSVLAVVLNAPVSADNGEIVLIRTVQPRSAFRTELAPDPHPLTVQAGGSKYANTELNDNDFAHINTGLSVSNSALTGQTNSLSSSNILTQPGGSAGNGLPGLDATLGGGSVGGATGGISGRVNGAIQTGLRPLQNMGMGN